MPTAELKSIKSLDGKTFSIPAYQRGYRWTRRQIKDLVEDLYNFLENSDAKKYCLQPIVVEEKADSSGNRYYSVIDGQQRLTSLYLLGAVCRSISYYQSNFPTYGNYDLIFEGKKTFQSFINEVKTFDKSNSVHSNLQALKTKYKDIDSQNAVNLLEFLINSNSNDLIFEIYKQLELRKNKKDICIIWHELEPSEIGNSDKAIETFANINANKIPLTDAELIKAVLLQAYGNIQSESNDNNHAIASAHEAAFASQWEAIERGLNNPKLWSFFVKDINAYKTRIDILFEIWLEKEGKVCPATDHALFKVINAHLSESPAEVEKFWEEIVSIYETLQDWYKDYYIYHMVGAISLLSRKEKNNAEFVCALYKAYNGCKKSEFRQKLRDKLREAYEEIIGDTDLRSLRYGNNNNQIKSSLLLFNIALLLNTNNVCSKNVAEWFPFDYYKENQIDIEHINPQNPEENKREKRLEWQSVTKDILCDAGEKDLVVSSEAEPDVKNATMEKWAAKAETHVIGNLTLVDHDLNGGFSNGTFVKKRDHVIAAMRGEEVSLDAGGTKSYDASVLLPGARWVFLREWRLEGGLSMDTFRKNYWSKGERNYYTAKIESALRQLLNMQNEEDASTADNNKSSVESELITEEQEETFIDVTEE